VKGQTVLLGLDGATFTVLDPLMRDGVMPFLREFVASGVSGELRSVIPALTPPAWTSLTTGRSPGHHGIFDFFCKEAPDSHHIRIATARDVRAETIWSLADRGGRRVTALNFPLMFPPPAVNGLVVPGWMPWRQMRLGCHPADLYDRLKKLPGFDARELAMDLNPEAKALQGCREDEYEEWVALHIRREKQWFAVLRALMREDPCELTAVVFDGVDRIQHLCWRFLAPDAGELTAAEQRIRERCLEYFRELDGILAQVVSAAGPEATVVFASDHGFGPQTGTFFVNAWLEQRGYLGWASEGAPRAEGAQALGIEQLARHDHLLDWMKTRAYAPTPSSNGIHIVPQGPEHPQGVPAAEYLHFRDRLASELRAVADPATGQPIVARVHTRDEAFAGPYKPLAPDLTLELHDGGLISILASDVHYRSRQVASGTHRREGIFLARGPGIESGVRLNDLSILDVAPLLLHSLGLPVPADMEGRLPAAAFHPTWLRQHPVRSGAAAPEEPAAVAVADAPAESLFTKDDEQKLAQRLRDLGYIE
jgi:predicted AlkP superfamily phosphohydrolase/phosphomutase